MFDWNIPCKPSPPSSSHLRLTLAPPTLSPPPPGPLPLNQNYPARNNRVIGWFDIAFVYKISYFHNPLHNNIVYYLFQVVCSRLSLTRISLNFPRKFEISGIISNRIKWPVGLRQQRNSMQTTSPFDLGN